MGDTIEARCKLCGGEAKSFILKLLVREIRSHFDERFPELKSNPDFEVVKNSFNVFETKFQGFFGSTYIEDLSSMYLDKDEEVPLGDDIIEEPEKTIEVDGKTLVKV